MCEFDVKPRMSQHGQVLRAERFLLFGVHDHRTEQLLGLGGQPAQGEQDHQQQLDLRLGDPVADMGDGEPDGAAAAG